MTIGSSAQATDARDLLAVCERVAASARAGEQIEAYAVRTRETDIEVFDAHVESLSIAGIDGVGVRVIQDGRQGFAWAGSLDETVVRDTVADARDNAEFAEPDEWNGMATPNDVASAPRPEMELWRDELLAVDTDRKVEFVLSLDATLRDADPRLRSVESASYGDGAIESALANSNGVSATVRRTICSASASALAGAGDATQSGYGFSVGRAFDELDLDAIVAMAVERTVRLLGAAPVSSRRVAVVLDPLVTSSLLGVLSAAFNAESMLKGRSLFQDRLGEVVAAPSVQLTDDPTDPRMMGASPHDAEGVPCRANRLVVDGVLQGFLHNTYTARRASTTTTGSASRGGYKSTPGVGIKALSFAPGTKTPNEILAAAGDAFYVQSVSGLHSGTNPISGDFSVGASGLMVRDGEFAEPVREVTVASTLPRMLTDIVEVGADLTLLPGSTAGLTLLIGEMTLSGT
jgi:PmbA protein